MEQRERESVVCEYVLAEGRRSAGINIYEKKKKSNKIVCTHDREKKKILEKQKKPRCNSVIPELPNIFSLLLEHFEI